MAYVQTTVLMPTEISIRTLGVCPGGCGRHVVARKRWNEITKPVRKQLVGKFAIECSRKLCRSCYDKHRARGTVIDFESRQVPGPIFAEEYNLMRQQGMTDYDIRISLKMTVAAFEKALHRNADKITEPRSSKETTA
jgi:hypothetical protein